MKQGQIGSYGVIHDHVGCVKYKGDFKNQIPNGKGVLIDEKADSTYTGDIQNWLYNGEGILSTNDYVYTGMF